MATNSAIRALVRRHTARVVQLVANSSLFSGPTNVNTLSGYPGYGFQYNADAVRGNVGSGAG